MPVDPQIQALLDMGTGVPATNTLSVAAARTQFPEAIIANYDEAFKLLKSARPGQFSAILTDLHFKIEELRKIPSAPFVYNYKNNMTVPAGVGAHEMGKVNSGCRSCGNHP